MAILIVFEKKFQINSTSSPAIGYILFKIISGIGIPFFIQNGLHRQTNCAIYKYLIFTNELKLVYFRDINNTAVSKGLGKYAVSK